MQIAAAHAPLNASRLPLSQSIPMALRLCYRVFEAINSALPTAGNMQGHLAGIAERSSLGNTITMIRRSYGLWQWPNPCLSESGHRARNYFAATLERHTGISTDDWMCAIHFIAWAWQIDTKRRKGPFATLSPMPRDDIDASFNAVLQNVIDSLSNTLSTISYECKQRIASADSITDLSLLPIKKWPMLQLDDPANSYLTLSPIHVAEAAVQRPLRIAEDTARMSGGDYKKQIQEVRGYFGELLEDYAHGLLKTSPTWKYECMRDLGMSCESLADGVAYTSDLIIFIELKNALTLESVRYTSRTDKQLFRELEHKHYIVKAQGQIRNSIKLVDSISKRIGNRPRAVASFIVCADVLPLTVVSKSLFESVLDNTYYKDDIKILRTSLMCIDDLEDIIGYMPTSWRRELDMKQSDDTLAFESMIRWLDARGTLYRNPRIMAEFDQAVISSFASRLRS